MEGNMDVTLDLYEQSLEETIGKNLRKKRVAAGWSINKLYTITGVDRQTIFHYEVGDRSPRIGKIMRICKATGWGLDDLMGGGTNA